MTDISLSVIAAGSIAYLLYDYHDIVNRFAYIDPIKNLEVIFGGALILIVMEGSRRKTGPTLPILALLSVIYAVFGLGLNIQGTLPALAIFALMMFALYGFGILISSLALFLKEGWIVAEGLYSILMILSPVAYPLAVLPNVARQVSGVFPTGSALIGMRSFLMEGYPAQAVGTIFLHLLV